MSTAATVQPLQAFLEQAKQQTGLENFGDSSFIEPLEHLIAALNSEAQLSEIGQYQAESSIAKGLANRLRIEDYIARHPDVLEQTITAPIFIVGLPRTGTTALHHLLNADPANHTLRLWEGNDPVPPPEDASYHSDPRIAHCRESVAMAKQFMPQLTKIHLMDAEAPDECHLLFGQNFMSVQYSAQFHIPSYANWLYAQDPTASYAYHKRQLQLLQYKKSGRWVLKTPYHQLGLKAILQHHPEAVIVQTHRDPQTIVASGCSLSETVRRSGSLRDDKHLIGRDWMEMLRAYIDRFNTDRQQLESTHRQQFVDIDYNELTGDLWPALQRIYLAGERQLNDVGKQAIQRWLTENPQGKHGRHHYCLADYGITEQQVEDLFANSHPGCQHAHPKTN